MVAITLGQLTVWYEELAVGPERPKLLSKLALLELCGWLETEQDRIILKINDLSLRDLNWTRRSVIDKTYGCDFTKHFRPMLAQFLGECVIRKLELTMDNKFPGDLEQLRSSTGDLWAKRCSFAHEDTATSVRKQQRFDAPSWSLNRYQILSKIFDRLEGEIMTIVSML